MPEVHFEVRWPDGVQRTYYSPSTAIRRHLAAGASYELSDFVQRARTALQAASERVRAKYGYTCSSALDTLYQIEASASGFGATEQRPVLVVAMDDS